ncbi:HAD family hydrolase [Glaciecola sp. MH2013]|uniref:D-glycero-alpha-D-manno-heptose-1,7-bisphosphate 7-phosphatase n=1 Tax=Glaciecola sp. MH2013 TaxID=2785524 RepID=UPI00189D4694|nr:HAD family hydrolase [Glaciecola sp. MH2013]MBF7072709.1 HAD family hydrolase [Glaciecola sp. MH2013]
MNNYDSTTGNVLGIKSIVNSSHDATFAGQDATTSVATQLLLLDRDGVININHGYVHKSADFDLVDGIVDLVKRANVAGIKVAVVTNQSGIGRGMYSEEQFVDLSQWMFRVFQQQGAWIDKVYYCPHHPQAAITAYKQQCQCRKPETGMLEQAISDFGVLSQNCSMIGDKALDVECAIRAKLAKAFYFPAVAGDRSDANIGSGHELLELLSRYEGSNTKVSTIGSLSEVMF